MAIIFRREKSALQNLNFWGFEKGHQGPLQQVTYDLCITYYDNDSSNERDSKLYDFYKNAFCTDLVLKVHDETVAVHGIVLSSKSEYFQVMLQSAFRESSTRIIDFSTSFQNMAVLKIVIDYIYTGKVILRQNDVEQVLGAAHLYMLHRLKEHCAQFLLEQLQPRNALKTWRLAHLYDMAELEVICRALLQAVFTRDFIDKTAMQDFTPNCLSALLNCDELVQTLHHKDVADLIIVWMKAGDVNSRKEIAKTLLLKYLKDKALDVILESICNLSFYGQESTSSELSPTLPNFHGKISWSSCQETEQATPLASLYRPKGSYNGLLVCEDSCNGLSLFCQESNKWSYEFVNSGQTPIGILDGGYLAFTGADNYTIHLKALTSTNCITPASILNTLMREGRVINPDEDATYYFCYSGRLYALLNLLVRSSSTLFLSLYQFDIVNNWSLLVDIPQEMDKQLFPVPFSSEHINVNLHYIPCDDDHIFLMTKLSLRNPSIGPLNWAGEQLGNGQPNMSIPKASICHLYKVNLREARSFLLSTSRQLLSNTELNNAFFFNQKLCFPEEKLQEIGQQQISDGFQIRCVCYDTASMEWCQEQLTLPSPVIEPVPLKQKGFPYSSVKVHGSFIYAGVHQAPYIFNVYLFSFDTFQWQKLPSIPSDCLSSMVLYPISMNRPINRYMAGDISGKQFYNSEFQFLRSSLKSWKGNRNK